MDLWLRERLRLRHSRRAGLVFLLIYIALTSVAIPGARAACLPAGSASADTIVCDGIDVLGVAADAGNEHRYHSVRCQHSLAAGIGEPERDRARSGQRRRYCSLLRRCHRRHSFRYPAFDCVATGERVAAPAALGCEHQKHRASARRQRCGGRRSYRRFRDAQGRNARHRRPDIQQR